MSKSYFAFAFDDFQMMVTGRQKLLTILFMVFLGTILIYKARGFGPEKVNNFQTTFGIGILFIFYQTVSHNIFR